MPAVAPYSKVLVTGANGYIGEWTIWYLLQRGFSVVGTVRTSEKGDRLAGTLRKKDASLVERFQYVVVVDILAVRYIHIESNVVHH